MRVAIHLHGDELERVQCAAAVRRLPLVAYVREACIAVSDATLSKTRFTTDPYARRPTSSTYPEPDLRRR